MKYIVMIHQGSHYGIETWRVYNEYTELVEAMKGIAIAEVNYRCACKLLIELDL